MRCTDADVDAICPPAVGTDTTPYILTASTLVDVYVGAQNLAPTVLFEMERWLAAHLFTLSHGGTLTQKKIGELTTVYDPGDLGAGLASTPYGQVVCRLDTTGSFATSGLKRAYIKVD